ncbi:MAG: biopolymer transporter ExbD [Longimicrobiales bacterium]|nr:biopolymer transporter ExbD [Longimicrobiales bacterium]
MNRGGRRARRQDLPIKAEINVTSLVDVAFTLLVIFIITAPMLQGGVEIQVPEADVAPVTSQTDPIYVTIQRDGRVFLAETEVPAEDLRTSLPQLLRAAGAKTVYIRGDAQADYQDVLGIIAAVSHIEGITFSLVANPIIQP